MKSNKIALIGVPSSAGARRTGQERAPMAFRAAGIVDTMQSAGLEVLDFGDQPTVIYRPDPDHPTCQNLGLVREVCWGVRDAVYGALELGAVPLILGGDCSITLGVVSGFLRHNHNLGLMYFDGDVDLNDPDITLSGIFDGMVMAHILGRGAPELARLGPPFPMLAEDRITLFGYNNGAGSIDPPEIELLQNSKMQKYPVDKIRNNVQLFAKEAIVHLEQDAGSILIHFDVDVIDAQDFPAADVLHSGGVPYEQAIDALRLFVSSNKAAGIVITEFNAERDPEGLYARQLVRSMAEVFSTK